MQSTPFTVRINPQLATELRNMLTISDGAGREFIEEMLAREMLSIEHLHLRAQDLEASLVKIKKDIESRLLKATLKIQKMDTKTKEIIPQINILGAHNVLKTKGIGGSIQETLDILYVLKQ